MRCLGSSLVPAPVAGPQAQPGSVLADKRVKKEDGERAFGSCAEPGRGTLQGMLRQEKRTVTRRERKDREAELELVERFVSGIARGGLWQDQAEPVYHRRWLDWCDSSSQESKRAVGE